MDDYKIVVGGVEVTVQLTDDEARRRGLAKAEQPKSKAVTPKNKAAGGSGS